MRRGRRPRRNLSQLDPSQSRQQSQQTRRNIRGRHLDPDSPLETLPPPRRSARLNRNPLESTIRTRASEAEITREVLRRRSRQLLQSRHHDIDSDNLPSQTYNSPNTPPSEPEAMHHPVNSSTIMMNGSDRSYTLELAYPLPRRVQAGALMNPPIAVRMKIRNTITGSEISAQDEISYYFVNISLHRESGNGPALAQNSGSQGSVASLEPINDQPPPNINASTYLDQQVGAFAHFSNWIIHRAGNYRVQFNLFKLEHGGSPVPGGRSVNSGHRYLASLMPEEVLVVQDDAQTPFYDQQTIEFINHVRAAGSSISSPVQ